MDPAGCRVQAPLGIYSSTKARDSPIRHPEAVKNEIDPFILQKREAKDLPSAPEAEKPQLLRRLSYLLTGLPPAPEVLEAFLRDSSSTAYEQQVDRLLASPHFGERWARHWMDVVRYAETRGHELDYPVLGAWRYRDYLIRAFNADVPYDQLPTARRTRRPS